MGGIPPFASDSDTSQQAARCIRSEAPQLRQRVLAFIIERGAVGATDEEVQAALRLRTQSETPRRNELCRMRLVRDSGRRRRTSSGRMATVWVSVTAASIGSCEGKR